MGDLNILSAAGKMNESSSNGSILKTQAEHGVESCQENDKEKTVSVVQTAINGDGKNNSGIEAGNSEEKTISIVQAAINGDGKHNSGTEAGNSEVEYIESENLNDVEDVDTSLKVS